MRARSLRSVQSLGPAIRWRYALIMCGRARLSSDVSEIKLVFSIPPHRPTPNIAPSWNVAPTDPLPVVRYDPKVRERSLDGPVRPRARERVPRVPVGAFVSVTSAVVSMPVRGEMRFTQDQRKRHRE